MIPQRSKLTPTRVDIGKPVRYVPEEIVGTLTDVQGIFAKFKFKPKKKKGKPVYATCDVRNLKLIVERPPRK
jgi:hypothetical protein